jgi:hypothetical protein
MGDGNYFLTSPVLDEIYPGLKVNLVENIHASSAVKDLRMEYATSDTNAAFSFGVRGSIPLELKGVRTYLVKIWLSFWM